MWVLAAKPDAHYDCAWTRCEEAYQVFLAWPAQPGFRFAENYWALLEPVTTTVSPCDGLKSTWSSGRTGLGTSQRDEDCPTEMTG